MGFIKYMYLADIFHGIALFGAVGIGICSVGLACLGLIWLEHQFDADGAKRLRKICAALVGGLLICMAAAFVVPSRQTMYAVAGARSVQEFANGPVAGDVAEVLKALKSILQSYAETP